MIPLVAAVTFRDKRSRSHRLWIPLALLWLLLLPVVLLLLPVVFIACWVGRTDPFRAVTVVWEILSALKGTDLEYDAREAHVLIHVF